MKKANFIRQVKKNIDMETLFPHPKTRSVVNSLMSLAYDRGYDERDMGIWAAFLKD